MTLGTKVLKQNRITWDRRSFRILTLYITIVYTYTQSLQDRYQIPNTKQICSPCVHVPCKWSSSKVRRVTVNLQNSKNSSRCRSRSDEASRTRGKRYHQGGSLRLVVTTVPAKTVARNLVPNVSRNLWKLTWSVCWQFASTHQALTAQQTELNVLILIVPVFLICSYKYFFFSSE